MTDHRYAAHLTGGADVAGAGAVAGVAATSAAALLFVPGDRPERFEKAVAGSDLAILDLEAAVADEGKGRARDHVRGWLAAGGRAAVRVNVPGSTDHELDLTALAGVPGILAVVVPLAEDVDALAHVAARLDAPVIALVESAVGVDRARELAAAESVVRLAFGSIDYALDIDAVESRESLLLARSTLVLASRVAGIAAPVDTVTTDVSPDGPAGADAVHARGLGFSGKLCIHPAQVDAVRAAFRPGADEIAWARSILAAVSSSAAIKVDGHMVDAPVIERARRVLGRVARSADGRREIGTATGDGLGPSTGDRDDDDDGGDGDVR